MEVRCEGQEKNRVSEVDGVGRGEEIENRRVIDKRSVSRNGLEERKRECSASR